MMRLLTIGAAVALLALPVAANNLITTTDETVQDQCAPEAKNALYQEFLKIRKDDQAKAFDLAKKYLACPAGEVTPEQQAIIDYLKKWSNAYETGKRKIDFIDALYTKKKYEEAFKIGRDILASEPDNLWVLVHLGANGYVVAPLKNQQLNTESVEYAKKALQQLESGKTIEDWAPLAGKDAAVAYLNFTTGLQTIEKEPGGSLKFLIKSAQFDTPLKKSAATYAYIAGAYETGPYAKQSEEYKRLYGGKDETPESKLALANIHQLVERMIDGYARAVAIAGNDPQYATQKPVWMESLTTWYKFLHNNSDAGMTELIATILSKPLPPEPTPLTSLPPASPTATPTGTSGAAPNNGNGTSGTTAPTGTTTPTNKASTTPTSTSKPVTPTTSPAKPAGAKPGTPDRPRN